MPATVACGRAITRAARVIAQPPGNLITADVVAQLRAALDDLAEARHLRLVTIAGDGADFSFGASVPEHRAGEIERVLPDAHALILDLLTLPVPTAAVVRGRCLGGGFELALACDFIFAADTATFGLPEIALGVFPPAASVLLPHRIGAARATSAILTGLPRSASDWHADGLIERVVADAELTSAVDDWFAASFAHHSAETLRHAVRAVRASIVDRVRRELPQVERLYLEDLMQSHDATEGIQAFLEKRLPRWNDQ